MQPVHSKSEDRAEDEHQHEGHHREALTVSFLLMRPSLLPQRTRRRQNEPSDTQCHIRSG